MRTRNLLLGLLIAAGVALPAAGQARTDFSLGINVGPPPAPVVVAPPPPVEPGYVWTPGYWAWDGYRHVWVEGRYVAPRPGYVWVPPYWDRRGPRHYFVEGRWVPEHGRHGHRW